MNNRLFKCVVVDDEPIARKILETYIDKIASLELVSSYENAVDALSYVAANDVDIVFSDIEMPDMNGVQFAQSLRDQIAIIFTTAHRNFAVEGYSIGVVDYLLKPVEFDRFVKAVFRAQISLEKRKEQLPKGDHIFVKTEGKLVKIIFKDIVYIEAMKDYLNIVTTNSSVSTLMTLKSMEELLDSKFFFRPHRSFIINTSYIISFLGNTVQLTGKKNIPISPQKKQELFNILRIV